MNARADGFITVSLESVANFERGHGSVAIFLRNSAHSVLKVHKISETAGLGSFNIKYPEGLLLFPGTVTHVAIVTCAHCADKAHESAREMSNVAENCKLLVQTNDSTGWIEIPCLDIVHLCGVGRGDKQIVSDDRTTSAPKAPETADSDELVLRNWKSLGLDTESSVLDDDEVFFPTTAVGTYHSKWIIAHNPSRQLVIMQLLLNSGEIIDKCRDKIEGLAEVVSSGKSLISKSVIRIRDGFSLIFHPSQRCEWKSLVLVRNNLSGVKLLLLHGSGGMRALAISDSAKPAREIKFHLESPDSSNSADSKLMSTQRCSRPLMKVLRVVNSGDLTLEVRSIRVCGTDCGLGGFVGHNCSNFSLRPGEANEIKISYPCKYSAPLVWRDLELALALGNFVLLPRATIPIKVIRECKRSIFWSLAKRILVAILVVASCVVFVFCCFYRQALGFSAPYCFCKRDGETILGTANRVAKSSKAQYSNKYSKLTLSAKTKRHLPSITIDEKAFLLLPDDDDNDVLSEEHEHVDIQSQVGNPGTVLLTPEKSAEEEELPSNMGDTKNGAAEEPTLPTNLTICIGKVKGRRRRKRKGAGSGLSALLEVSSSHSGNSTPSSPLSPVSSTVLTPRRAWPKLNNVEECLGTRILKPRTPEPIKSLYLSTPMVTLIQPAVPPPSPRLRSAAKPVLLPSATFPGSSHQLSSRARIASHARAPGSRLCGERAPTVEENSEKSASGRKELTYDIWGDHFSAMDLTGKGRCRDDDNSVRISGGVVDIDHSDYSFFARGPPVLLMKYGPEQPLGSNEK